MTKTKTDYFRFVCFATIYFVQGAALAYFMTFQKPYLQSVGVPLGQIAALTSCMLIPFILKIFISALSDRWSPLHLGHRKPYIYFGLSIASLSFFSASLFSAKDHFSAFAVSIFCASMGIAFFDSATDGLAIDISKPEEHGKIQSVMISARAIGLILFSLLFGQLAKTQDFTHCFWLLSALFVFSGLTVFFVRAEKAGSQLEEKLHLKSLATPMCFILGFYGVVYSIASFGTDGLVSLFLKSEFNVMTDDLGIMGALRGGGSVAGALLAGFLFARCSRKAVSFTAMLALAAGIYIWSLVPSANLALNYIVLWGVIWSLQETVYMTLAMGYANPQAPALSFSLLMVFSNIGTSIGEGLATSLVENLGFRSVFTVLVGIGGLAGFLLVVLFTLESRKRAAAPVKYS